jgi:hypothetical protein
MALYFQPRYSLRWLFIAITFVAVLLVVGRWWWLRAAELERRAVAIQEQVQGYADTAWGIQRFGGFTDEANVEAQRYWGAYWDGHLQADHLRRAKWRVWLSTETKPIEDPYRGKRIRVEGRSQ